MLQCVQPKLPIYGTVQYIRSLYSTLVRKHIIAGYTKGWERSLACSGVFAEVNPSLQLHLNAPCGCDISNACTGTHRGMGNRQQKPGTKGGL